MVPINKIAEQILQANPSQSLYLKLHRDWELIFGKLNSKVKLEKVDKHTITLSVTDSSWMQELHLLSNVLIDKINKYLKETVIKKIKLKITEDKKIKKQNIKQEQTIILKPIKLNSRESLALDKIEDKELAKQLKKFLIKCKQ